MTRKASSLGIVLLAAVFGAPSWAQAEGSEARGAVSCSGVHLNLRGGTEAHRSLYVVNNPNPSTALSVERIRFFTADHSLAYDSLVSGFPPSAGAVLNAADRVLEPRQTVQYALADLLEGHSLVWTERPGMLLIEWSAKTAAAPLAVSHMRVVRERDPGRAVLGEERTRSHHGCRELVPDEAGSAS